NGDYQLRATDHAGNVTNETVTVDFYDLQPGTPVRPTAAADITEPTNQNVTVSATFSADTTEKQYSLDGSNWQDYTDGIVMEGNGTVYFRGGNEFGYSPRVSYTVSNIDKIAPEKPAAQADITGPTNGSVTVTAAFSRDSVKKEYTLDGGETWQPYDEGGVIIIINGTVGFRGIDAAGNISEVTSYEVTNIEPEVVVTGGADDLNGDGRADVIMSVTEAGHGAEGATGAWLIQGDQTAAWGDLSTRNAGWTIFGTGKTAAGKNTDDVYVVSDSNMIGAWTTGDDGKVNGWETIGEFDSDTQIVGLGDFNGNGQTDLLLRNVNGAVGCFFTGGETTGWNYFQSLGDEWKLSAIGDLNGDGRADVVLKHDAGFAGCWLTQTDGTVAWADLDTLGDGFEIVGAGDFNGDGTDDVLLTNGSYYGAWLVQNGNAAGWFGLGDLGNVTVEQIADFNGDGTDDLRIRTAAGDIGAQLVMGEDTLDWHYYGSVGAEWSTSLAALS
ncbi:MAG: FG-GAP repeat protein, partial [Lentisphaeria bacterium]|nr:FG-GAP repeat protein [Lentisphaeria bacterium]